MMTNPAHIAETALLLLGAYLLGCIIGYGARRLLHVFSSGGQARAGAPAAPVSVSRSPAVRLAASVEHDPPPLQEPPAIPADNLRKIKGIGPKIESSLQALGIVRLEQIASWAEADIELIDAQLPVHGRIRRDRWVEQARELVGGGGHGAGRD
jgi:NADH-quinone oxidoreductase subunit E